MEYRRLGKSGLLVSALSLGSWTTFGKQVGEDVATACLTAAYDAGVNLFDTGEGYADGEAERILGRTLKKNGWRRDTLVLSTKVFYGGDLPNQRGLSRKHIMDGLSGSLSRLGVDYVDILFCHRPDLHTPVEETVRAMDVLIRQGRVLYWGTSFWPPERVREAYEIADRHHLTPPSAEQPPYSLLETEQVDTQLAPLCDEFGLGLTTFSPLYGGVLSGKYRGGAVPKGSRAEFRGQAWVRQHIGGDQGPERLRQVDQLANMAAQLQTTPACLAIAWCLTNRRISSVITGATSSGQVAENMGAIALSERLDDTIMANVERIFIPEKTGE